MQKGVKDATHTVIFSSTKNIMGKTGFGPPKPGTLEGTHIQCFGKNMVGISSGITHNMDWRVWHPNLTYFGEMLFLIMPKYMKFCPQPLKKCRSTTMVQP